MINAGLKVLEGTKAHVHENGNAHAARPGEALQAGAGHAHWRVGLLDGLGHQADVVKVVELALIAEFVGGPGLQDDLQSLPEAAPAFGVGDVVAAVGNGEPAAADAEVEPALAYLVHGGRFLGDADGVVQGQDLHGDAHAHPFGAVGDGGGHDNGRRQHRTLGLEVAFGQPDAVEARFFRHVHLLEAVAEGGGLVIHVADIKLDGSGKFQDLLLWPGFRLSPQ